MSREMSMFAMAGYLKRISELPEENMLKVRPRELRKICIVDNKHNPDFYVVGLIVAFLGIEYICRWYPVLMKQDGRAAFLKGIVDAGEDSFDYMDILGELWRVRRSDPPVFDAALYLKYGGVRQAEVLAALFMRGPAELEKRQEELAREMEYYGLIDDEWLDHRKHSKEQEIERKTVNAQL